MTAEEYNKQLTELHGLVSGDLASDTIIPAATVMLARIKNRIANEGKNSDGGNIGNYSTTPIYVTPKQFVSGGFNAQGKRNAAGNTIGDRLIPTVRLSKTGVKRNPAKYQKYSLVKPNLTQRKSMYLQEGYKELRDIQGLRTDIMNFKYSGNLLESYRQQQNAQTVLQGFTTEKSALIREGLEAIKGTVFSPTEEEIKQYLADVTFSITRLTRNTIQGYNVTATVN